jgi:hypothetical protein
MSIIHDALRKTQNKMDNKDPKAPGQPGPDPTSDAQKDVNVIYEKLHQKKVDHSAPPGTSGKSGKGQPEKNTNQGGPVFLLFLLIIALAGTVYFIYFKGKKINLPKPHFSSNPSRSLKTKPVPTYRENEIVLNGTMMMGDRQVALINNEIYELGESVKGKKIVSISLQKVELEEPDGNVTVLKVQSYK